MELPSKCELGLNLEVLAKFKFPEHSELECLSLNVAASAPGHWPGSRLPAVTVTNIYMNVRLSGRRDSGQLNFECYCDDLPVPWP